MRESIEIPSDIFLKKEREIEEPIYERVICEKSLAKEKNEIINDRNYYTNKQENWGLPIFCNKEVRKSFLHQPKITSSFYGSILLARLKL